MFERNGIYYLTFPHVENKIERLEYATGDNPLGPFKMTGVIMDQSSFGNPIQKFNGTCFIMTGITRQTLIKPGPSERTAYFSMRMVRLKK